MENETFTISFESFFFLSGPNKVYSTIHPMKENKTIIKCIKWNNIDSSNWWTESSTLYVARKNDRFDLKPFWSNVSVNAIQINGNKK